MFLSPRCIGMPCFDPQEFHLEKRDRPVGQLLAWTDYAYGHDYLSCRGFWNRIRKLPGDKCPENFDEFDPKLAKKRVEDDNWRFRRI